MKILIGYWVCTGMYDRALSGAIEQCREGNIISGKNEGITILQCNNLFIYFICSGVWIHVSWDIWNLFYSFLYIAIFDAIKQFFGIRHCWQMLSWFDSVTCDIRHSSSRNIPCVYDLTMRRYEKILQPSNVHNKCLKRS